jgi:hypothetical protein
MDAAAHCNNATTHPVLGVSVPKYMLDDRLVT